VIIDLEYKIEKSLDGHLVKSILRNELKLSSRYVKKLKYSSRILLNDLPVHVNVKVKEGDILKTEMDIDEEHDSIIPEEGPLGILFEDKFILALNKPTDMVVHPTYLHSDGTLANFVMNYYNKNNIKTKIRPVNRIDRDTTGVVIFAKKQFIQDALVKQMIKDTFVKEYLGIVCGIVKEDTGVINLPIARAKGSIITREVSENGDPSITRFSVVERLDDATLLKFILETGRTHQIRVHCLASGFPLIGDTLYGRKRTFMINRQALHSFNTSFIHPVTGNFININAPIPHDFTQLYTLLTNGKNISSIII
jgi:23S rRNA pseudouridine1911/1915/1917 synthase